MVAVEARLEVEGYVARELNDADLILWGIGWFLKRARLSGEFENNSLADFGAAIGMSGPGYKKIEDGNSPNIRAILAALNHVNKRYGRVMVLIDTIVLEIDEEEKFLGRELTLDERERIANRTYDGIKNL